MSIETITVVLGGNVPAPASSAHGQGTEVVGAANTGSEAVAKVLAELPDVLLLDARIADPDARAVCRQVREWAPATKVLAITEVDDESAYTTIVAGACGVVIAGLTSADLLTAITSVANGETVLQSRMASRLLHDLDSWAERSADPLHPPPTLTATEREVLTALGAGHSPTTIAASHSVTAHLVNLHAGYAVAKLHRYVLGAERIAAQG
jgi:DNA-binding NarL/FixJ family response regulator